MLNRLELHAELGKLLSQSKREITRVFGFALTPEQLIILDLISIRNRKSQELIDILDKDKGNICRMMQRLKRDSFVVLKEKYWSMTEKGLMTYEKMIRRGKKNRENITKEEIKWVTNLTVKLGTKRKLANPKRRKELS